MAFPVFMARFLIFAFLLCSSQKALQWWKSLKGEFWDLYFLWVFLYRLSIGIQFSQGEVSNHDENRKNLLKWEWHVFMQMSLESC